MRGSPSRLGENTSGRADDDEDINPHAELTSRIHVHHLHELALSTRHKATDSPPDLTCDVETPPKYGSYNLMYKVTFSDGAIWAIRVPVRDDVDTPTFRQSMRQDVITQQYITSRTSVPIPRIHAWSNTCDNPILRPYTIYQYVQGTQLCYLWNDRTWINDEKRRYIFKQLAAFSADLASFEFDTIGRLGFDDESQAYFVAPFPDFGVFFLPNDVNRTVHYGPAGPFHSGVNFMLHVLQMRRRASPEDTRILMLQMFLPLLTNLPLDGPPFVLGHPDLDSQNVLVSDDGTITAIIDWDDVFIAPRQIGTTVYPSWITVDWDPIFYGWTDTNTEQENLRFDPPEDLVKFRQWFLDAMDKASGGRYTEVARNSHIAQALFIAIQSEAATSGIIARFFELIFGSYDEGIDFTVAVQDGPFCAAAPGTTVEMPSGEDDSEDEQ